MFHLFAEGNFRQRLRFLEFAIGEKGVASNASSRTTKTTTSFNLSVLIYKLLRVRKEGAHRFIIPTATVAWNT